MKLSILSIGILRCAMRCWLPICFAVFGLTMPSGHTDGTLAGSAGRSILPAFVGQEKANSHKLFAVYSRVLPSDPRQTVDGPPVFGLYVKKLPDGAERLLVRGKSVAGLGRIIAWIRIDPSGRRLAFLSDVPDASFALPNRTTVKDLIRTHALWVIGLDGSGCRRLPLKDPVIDMQWSSDGSAIAAEVAHGESDHIVFVPLGAGNDSEPIHKLAAVQGWAWWPLGHQLVVYGDMNKDRIVLKKVGGSGEKQQWHLPHPGEMVLSFTPAPDGRAMLIITDSGAYLAKLSSSHLQRVLNDLTNPAEAQAVWSPDSQRIALHRIRYPVSDPPSALPPERHSEVDIRSGKDFNSATSIYGKKSDYESTDLRVVGWFDNSSVLLLGAYQETDAPSNQITRFYLDRSSAKAIAEFGDSVDSVAIYRDPK